MNIEKNLIYDKIVDFSKETEKKDNYLFIRIFLIKKYIFNIFKGNVKQKVNYLIEYKLPKKLSTDNSITLTHFSTHEQRKYNNNVININENIERKISLELWKSEKFVFDYIITNNIHGKIKKRKIE